MSYPPREDVRRLDALTDAWATAATHPAFPGTTVPGRSIEITYRREEPPAS